MEPQDFFEDRTDGFWFGREPPARNSELQPVDENMASRRSPE
jgi:hypothetical protein